MMAMTTSSSMSEKAALRKGRLQRRPRPSEWDGAVAEGEGAFKPQRGPERGAGKAQRNRAKRLECGAFPRFRAPQTVREWGNTPHSKRFATSGAAQNFLAACEPCEDWGAPE